MNTSLDITQFEEVVSTYQKELVYFHYRFTGNRFDAEDLAQETFVKAYFKYHTLKEPEKLKSWLYQIARNIVIDFFRKNKKRKADIAIDEAMLENIPEQINFNYQQDILNHELSKEMEQCLNLLNPDDRKLMQMLYYEGFTYKEIGALLQVNENTLKSRLHRARKFLIDIIKGSDALRDLVPISLKS